MLDVGGQDSTEAFEDVGHSDEAREILDGLLVGTLKRQVNISLPYTYTYTLTISRFSKHVYNIHATTVRPSAVPSSGPSPQNTSPAISHPFTPAKHTPYLAPRIWASEPFRPHSNPYHTHTHTPTPPNLTPHHPHNPFPKTEKESKLTRPKQEGDPKPKSYAQSGATASTTDGASTGVGLYAIILIGGALAFGAYKYLQAQSEQQ
jgi:hypothetical protein